MDDWEIDPEVRSTVQRVVDLSRHVEIDPGHKARVRDELLRRHRELPAGAMHHGSSGLQLGFGRLKRLAIIAPPALAVATAALILVWGLQISGHQTPQSAEAARITQALARTAPTVTSWSVNLQQQRGDTTIVSRIPPPVRPGDMLYVRGDRSYLYSRGKWYWVTFGRSTSQRLADWQWAFAALPAHLANHQFVILPKKRVMGQNTEGVRYSMLARDGTRVVATCWVNVKTGLVVQLDRVVLRGHKVVESDIADYVYKRNG